MHPWLNTRRPISGGGRSPSSPARPARLAPSALSLALLLGAALGLGACGGGEGSSCEIDSDCGGALICCEFSGFDRGNCTLESECTAPPPRDSGPTEDSGMSVDSGTEVDSGAAMDAGGSGG